MPERALRRIAIAHQLHTPARSASGDGRVKTPRSISRAGRHRCERHRRRLRVVNPGLWRTDFRHACSILKY
ncbi:hypothetical protein [Ferrovum myxofaciens]|uniref:hypothetical protein n=1 Tax=Ferrovum myxofaciens TaxID=416213 RepID=UPI003EC0C2AD